MKIIVKPKTIKNLNKTSADGFIFGMEDFCINPTVEVDIKTLLKLKKMLKDKEIFLSIDKNIFDKDLEKLKQILIEIDKLNLAGILFYDIGMISLRDKLKLKTKLIWNQNFFVTNYKTLEFYNKYNIQGAVISSEITIDEIKEIANRNKDMFLFVNGFGYQLMSFSKRKLISNYFKYIKRKDFIKKHFLKDKTEKYRIIEYKEGTAILSSSVLNTITEINTFKEINIDYLILDEKELKEKDFLFVLDLYNKANNEMLTKEKLIEYDNTISKMLNTNTGFLYKKTIYKVK